MAKSLAISACIVAMNEEDNIGACLSSVGFCDDVVVVDSHSSDRTRDIAESSGARVFERDWPGFGAQKNYAVQQAKHDRVLCLDADEQVSDALREEILDLGNDGLGDRSGWRIPRLSNYLGTWMRHGGWYPDLQLRIYDRRRGRWEGSPPHEHVGLDGAAGRLRSPIHHRPYRSVEDHLRKIDDYTSVMAREMQARGRRAGILDVLARPPLRFLRFYVLKAGFVHGWTGLFLAYLDAHYVRLKYAKLLCLQRGLPLETPPHDSGHA